MAEEKMKRENVASLIDHLLQEKDPATVGLRKILKTKKEQGRAFPCRSVQLEEFGQTRTGRKIFSDSEKYTLLLEKKNHELEKKIVDLEKKVEQERQSGFAAGKKEGMSEGEALGVARTNKKIDEEVAAIREQVSATLHTFDGKKRRVFSDAESVLLKLVFIVAKKVLGVEVQQNREVIRTVITKAVRYVAEKSGITIRVSPQDYQSVDGKKDFWAPVTDRLQDIVVETDDRLSPGDCLIESETGIVDGRIETQIHELESLVEKVWEAVLASRQQPGDAGAVMPSIQDDTTVASPHDLTDETSPEKPPDAQE